MRSATLLAGCLLVLHSQQAITGDSIAFTPREIERILAHGPWPRPAKKDPSNRVSGRPEAIALGERFFFSPRLSGTGGVLCASCHEPWRGFSDGRARAFGLELVDRNTPTLANVRLNRWFGWDGSNDNLWAQSIRPLLDPREMASSAAHIAALVRGDPELAEGYEKAFGTRPLASDEALLADVGKALAAYQETLASGRTAFDEFRDALARKDRYTMGRYPAQAQRGLRIFLGNCAACHAGPNFSDGVFHRTGIASMRQNGEPDTGRQGGIRKLLASRFNLLGPYNDDASRAGAAGTQRASAETETVSAFRTPGLRDVLLTAPYMHDGSLATLCQVAQAHPAGGTVLSPQEKNDLAAFLETLTAIGRRFPAEKSPTCH